VAGHPAFEHGDERSFVKRVHADVGRLSCDGAITGYTVGKTAVLARLYNKSLQTKKKRVEWYPELLCVRNGSRYDPEVDVRRLEFELRREGLVGFKLRGEPEASDPDEEIEAELAGKDLPRLHSVRKALHWAGRLWAYLTGHWLRLVVPNEDSNRGRRLEHPTWRALREGWAAVALHGAPPTEPELELVRAKRHTGYRRLLDRMATGVLTAVEAMDTNPGAALHAYTAYMARLATKAREC